MAIHLTCFIGLCLQIAARLYDNRKAEKKQLRNKSESYNEKGKRDKYRRELTIEECGQHWTRYKNIVNKQQVKIR